MKQLIWCVLFFLCASSKQMVLDHSSAARWRLYDIEKGHRFIRNFKRHSDGTFTSDFTNNHDKMKAKDFVMWLASTKKERCYEDVLEFPGV